MALSARDREILQDCIEGQPEGWREFVDRYLGLMIHVVRHTAARQGLSLRKDQESDVLAEVFLQLLSKDKAILRRFAGNSSLATYLVVVTRRIAHKQLVAMRNHAGGSSLQDHQIASDPDSIIFDHENREAIEHALNQLDLKEAQAIRLFHFEGRGYREIGESIGLPENSVGPLLSVARKKLQRFLS